MGDVHDLLKARGRQQACAMMEGKGGLRIVEAAAAWATDQNMGTAYMYSGWCQTASPHKRPPDNSTIS